MACQKNVPITAPNITSCRGVLSSKNKQTNKQTSKEKKGKQAKRGETEKNAIAPWHTPTFSTKFHKLDFSRFLSQKTP